MRRRQVLWKRGQGTICEFDSGGLLATFRIPLGKSPFRFQSPLSCSRHRELVHPKSEIVPCPRFPSSHLPMNRYIRAHLTLLFLLVSSCQRDPLQSQPPAFLADTESWVVTSSITKRKYQISVALPAGYREQNKVYPVLYAVDANTEFGTLVETARSMEDDDLIPNIVFVGI